MKSEISKPDTLKNPFDHFEQGLNDTFDRLQELKRLHDDLIQKFTKTERKDFRCPLDSAERLRKISFKDYGRNGSKIVEDEQSAPDGTDYEQFVYQIFYPRNHDDRYTDGSLIYRWHTPQGRKREFSLRSGDLSGGMLGFESIDHDNVRGLEKDGLHLRTREQGAWNHAWRQYFFGLLHDEIFSRALKQSNLLPTGNDLGGIDPETMDLEAFVRDLETLWQTAYSTKIFKKKFPGDKAPFNLGQFPPDRVVPHAVLQKMISFTIERLKDTVRILDEHQFPDKPQPYR